MVIGPTIKAQTTFAELFHASIFVFNGHEWTDSLNSELMKKDTSFWIRNVLFQLNRVGGCIRLGIYI